MKRSADDVKAAPMVIIGIVGAILLFAVIVLLSALFLSVQQSEAEKKAQSAGPGNLRRMRAEQIQSLSEYRWVDAEKKIVAVPIDRAMDLLILEVAEEKGR